MTELAIGIDGGGSSCRAAVADRTGKILGRGTAGPANILSNLEGSLENIILSAKEALRDAALAPETVSSVSAVVGVAGANVGDYGHRIEKALPFADGNIESDGLIALQGALGDGDGAVAILGTGTIYIARTKNHISYVGGWGFHIGDLGSGARLGQMALRESLLAHDGIISKTPLSTSILAEFSNDPPKMVAFAQKAKPSDYGRFAPRVFEYASAGDETALGIIRQSAAWIDAAADRVAEITGGGRLCLLGGLAGLYPPYLAPRHRARLVAAADDALTGAIALARASFSGYREVAE